MATREQLERALKNADAAGDVEAARILAGELKRMKAQPDPIDLRAETGRGQTLRVGPFDTGLEMPQPVTEALAGAGRRMTQIGTLGMNTPQPEADALLNQSTPAMLGGAAVDVGALALGGAGLKAAGALPHMARLASAGGALQAPKTLAQAVLTGAAYGAATSPDRFNAALGGALGGGAGYGMVRMAGALFAPSIPLAADDLLKRNVRLTPGEIFGSWVQRIEDGLTSVPLAGDMIRRAKLQSIEDFNRSILDDVLSHLGQKTNPVMGMGRETLEVVDDLVSGAYRAVLPNMKAQPDFQFLRDIGKLRRMALTGLPQGVKDQFDDVVRNTVLRSFKGPTKTALGETLKETDSQLGLLTRNLKNAQSPYDLQLRNALIESQRALRDLIRRQNPAFAQELDNANAAFAKLAIVRDASSRAGAAEGIFTPAQLVAAIKKSAGQRKFFKGKGLMQKYAENAKQVLPSKVPDSGTPLRGAILTGTAGALTGAVNPPAGLAMLGAQGALAGLYSQPGQNLLRTLLTQRPDLLAQAGQGANRLAPRAGMLGIGFGVNQ